MSQFVICHKTLQKLTLNPAPVMLLFGLHQLPSRTPFGGMLQYALRINYPHMPYALGGGYQDEVKGVVQIYTVQRLTKRLVHGCENFLLALA